MSKRLRSISILEAIPLTIVTTFSLFSFLTPLIMFEPEKALPNSVYLFDDITENQKIIEPEKALPNFVFLFDDITENQKIARTYFSRGRHNLIIVFYLAQSYSKLPKQLLRDNSNCIVPFK